MTTRRPQSNDTLMADEPPRVLGWAIPVVAILLTLILVALRLVEYQDVVPVSLTLKAGDSFGRAYGEAYLQQGEASVIRAEQAVDIDLSGYGGLKGSRLRAKVREITPFDMNSLYRLRVDLPSDFALESLSGASPDAVRVEAKILTQKQDLFHKLFGAFRVITRNL